MGVAVSLPDHSWAVYAIVSGVVLTTLRGDRGELFGGSLLIGVDPNSTDNSMGYMPGDENPLPSMPVVCNVKKPLEVSDTMPLRQEVGIYSWESIAMWAAPPLPNEAPAETFCLDDGLGETGLFGLEYRLVVDDDCGLDIKPMTGVDNRPPTAYLRIEFDDEIELENLKSANAEAAERLKCA